MFCGADTSGQARDGYFIQHIGGGGGGGGEGMVNRYRYLAHSVYDFYVYVTTVSLPAVTLACPDCEAKCTQKCCLRQCGK